LGFESIGVYTFLIPYCLGLPIDSILHEPMSSSDRDAVCLKYQSLVCSLNWLVHTTQQDLPTAISLLAQHESNPSPGHLEASLYVSKYLASMKNLGIYFTSHKRSILESFLHFHVPHQVQSLVDATWGPQDALQSHTIMELPLFVSRSLSAFYIDSLCPIHWLSKGQTFTAESSAEAEIYATDECIKFLLKLVQIFR
jgi:hypothetical protein